MRCWRRCQHQVLLDPRHIDLLLLLPGRLQSGGEHEGGVSERRPVVELASRVCQQSASRLLQVAEELGLSLHHLPAVTLPPIGVLLHLALTSWVGLQ